MNTRLSFRVTLQIYPPYTHTHTYTRNTWVYQWNGSVDCPQHRRVISLVKTYPLNPWSNHGSSECQRNTQAFRYTRGTSQCVSVRRISCVRNVGLLLLTRRLNPFKRIPFRLEKIDAFLNIILEVCWTYPCEFTRV